MTLAARDVDVGRPLARLSIPRHPAIAACVVGTQADVLVVLSVGRRPQIFKSVVERVLSRWSISCSGHWLK